MQFGDPMVRKPNIRSPSTKAKHENTIVSFLLPGSFLYKSEKSTERDISHRSLNQTPLKTLTTKNQQAPINLIALRAATLYKTTPM